MNKIFRIASVGLASILVSGTLAFGGTTAEAVTYSTCSFTINVDNKERKSKVSGVTCTGSANVKVGPWVRWYNSSAGQTEYYGQGNAVHSGSSSFTASGPVFSRAGWYGLS